ncbi:hypothetical protein GGS26DRAFT_232705 [Hypomontagnella submonticulosa]|nr:hypothetical protein GGS26DRAFT_232705 [Hypomontagnella submonticulosa]
MALAFAFCTAFTYLLLLGKPKDVQHSIVIHAARYATPQELMRLTLAGPTTYGTGRSDVVIPNSAVHANRSRSAVQFFANLAIEATFSVAIFRGVHCVAWDFKFAFPNWQPHRAAALASELDCDGHRNAICFCGGVALYISAKVALG